MTTVDLTYYCIGSANADVSHFVSHCLCNVWLTVSYWFLSYLFQ